MIVARTFHRCSQVAAHLRAVVADLLARRGLGETPGADGDERLRELQAPPALRAAFSSAHPADRASGTRLAARLRRDGASEAEEYAALLHDLPKGHVGLLPRVMHVLRGSPRECDPVGRNASATRRLRTHADEAPRLAAQWGAPDDVVEILTALAIEERSGDSHDMRARRLLALDSAGVPR